MRKGSIALGALACAAMAFVAGSRLGAAADDGSKILTIDHYVRLTSKVPSIAGQQATIYVREKVRAIAWDYASVAGGHGQKLDAQLGLLVDPLSVFMSLVVKSHRRNEEE